MNVTIHGTTLYNNLKTRVLKSIDDWGIALHKIDFTLYKSYEE